MADPYAERVVAQRQAAAAAYKATLQLAASENRDLRPAEQDELDRLDASMDRMTDELSRLAKAEARLAPAAALRASIEPALQESHGMTTHTGLTTEGQILSRLMQQAATGTNGYFDSRINPALFEKRALSGNVGTAIATTFADFVTVYQRTLNPMLDPNVVTILGRDNGAPLVLPRLTADPNHGGTVTAEAAGINELDPTISQVTLTPYKYASTTIWSNELQDDNTIGLEQLIAKSISRELTIDLAAHLTTGDGSGKPQGFIGVATNGGTASGTAGNNPSDTFFAYTDLVNLYYSIPAPYRSVGSWMFSTDALAKARKMRDSTGQPIWIPSLFGGQPDTLLGRPVYENPAMATVASASKSVAFGDFSQYVVARVSPIRVNVSLDYKFSTDQIALRVIDRVDGDLIDTASVAYLVSANT